MEIIKNSTGKAIFKNGLVHFIGLEKQDGRCGRWTQKGNAEQISLIGENLPSLIGGSYLYIGVSFFLIED